MGSHITPRCRQGITHRHMSPLLTKEPPDVTEGCQGTLPLKEKTQHQPAPRPWLEVSGSGTQPTPDRREDSPWGPLSLFKVSLLCPDFQAHSAPEGWKPCFCLWEYFLKYHFSELSLLILTCTYPGSHFAMFMISNCHACSLMVNKNALKTTCVSVGGWWWGEGRHQHWPLEQHYT